MLSRTQHRAHHTPSHLATFLDPQKVPWSAPRRVLPLTGGALQSGGLCSRPDLESQATRGLELRPGLSQPSGRSLSGQCDFPPPGFVAMAISRKTRLWVFYFGKEHPKLHRAISTVSGVTHIPASHGLLLPSFVSGMWGLSPAPLLPLLSNHLSKNRLNMTHAVTALNLPG